jgi:HEAT repeat protein
LWSTTVLAVVLGLAAGGMYCVWKGSLVSKGPPAADWKQLIPPAGPTQKADPLSAEEFPRAAADLKSADPLRRRAAAARLAQTPPNEHRAEVARDLAPLAQEPDVGVGQAAVEALGVWGTGESVPLLVRLTRAYSGELRWAAIHALAKLGDASGAEAIATRLMEPGDRQEAARALEGMGAKAEKAVATLLRSSDAVVRREACQLLEKIGTKESVPALEKAGQDEDEDVRRAAATAVKAVQSRPQQP